MDDFIYNYWIKKYTPEIINFINLNVAFEELEAPELEIRRKEFILAYVDTCDSTLAEYLLIHLPNFLDLLYNVIFKPNETPSI